MKDTIGLLLVILLLTCPLFALIHKQEQRIDSLERSMQIMADMQGEQTQWISDIHELAADNAIRIRGEE